MDREQAPDFVRLHGVVLASAAGPVPALTGAIAGEKIKGSWWGHAVDRCLKRPASNCYGRAQAA